MKNTRDKKGGRLEMTPLVVDLDGTLVKTDTLHEAVIRLIARNPLYVLLLPFWLLGGKAVFKEQVARRVSLDPAMLPYNEALLTHLKEERDNGRSLVLATASHKSVARSISEHLGIFDEVFASDRGINLSRTAKRDKLLATYGADGFDYVGNSRADVPVWSVARRALVVGATPGLKKRIAADKGVHYFEGARKGLVSLLIKALRPHQWAKNLLVFVPIIAGHELTSSPKLTDSIILFVAFCLCASGVYLVNDLVDLEADRHHSRKRKRPFASGDLPVVYGVIGAPFLLLGAGVLAAQISLAALGMLGLYFGLTLAYSFALKRVVLIDVIALAALYTLRILSGIVALDQSLSFWLLAFSVFLFFSLAMIKRHTELLAVRAKGGGKARGRGYHADDIEMLVPLGVAAGYVAVMIFALYINSDSVTRLYSRPEWLWMVCPVLLYWVSRMWIVSHRGEMHDDPIVYAMSDRASLAAVAVGGIFVFLAV